MTAIFINGQQVVADQGIVPDLPTVDEMIKVVRWYIHKTIGQLIIPIINTQDEHRELSKLEFMYRYAMRHIQF